MPYESLTGLNVSNHYGPRGTGSAEGVVKTEGADNEATINFDGEDFDLRSYVPAGAVVYAIDDSLATGAVTAATVGLVDISGASTAAVAVPLGGVLTVTGPTAGYVIVRYTHLA